MLVQQALESVVDPHGLPIDDDGVIPGGQIVGGPVFIRFVPAPLRFGGRVVTRALRFGRCLVAGAFRFGWRLVARTFRLRRCLVAGRFRLGVGVVAWPFRRGCGLGVAAFWLGVGVVAGPLGLRRCIVAGACGLGGGVVARTLGFGRCPVAGPFRFRRCLVTSKLRNLPALAARKPVFRKVRRPARHLRMLRPDRQIRRRDLRRVPIGHPRINRSLRRLCVSHARVNGRLALVHRLLLHGRLLLDRRLRRL
ncbi:hypothetical protein, partial [Amycolatopsis thermoflava]|uniref:hypothetical protein n=1 Tax=Amycolatopsis thermoflava TaxID=84480 RepID=UPI003824D223